MYRLRRTGSFVGYIMLPGLQQPDMRAVKGRSKVPRADVGNKVGGRDINSQPRQAGC